MVIHQARMNLKRYDSRDIAAMRKPFDSNILGIHPSHSYLFELKSDVYSDARYRIVYHTVFIHGLLLLDVRERDGLALWALRQ